MPAGRPQIELSPEMIEAIEDQIVSGDSIASICGSELFPHPESTFWRRFARDAEFASVIVRALEARCERDIERCRMEAAEATADDWQVAQLRIRTYQWEAGKRKPKKYGDTAKLQLTGEDGGPLIVKHIGSDGE